MALDEIQESFTQLQPNVSDADVVILAEKYGVEEDDIEKIEYFDSFVDKIAYVKVQSNKSNIPSCVIKISKQMSKQQLDMHTQLRLMFLFVFVYYGSFYKF